MLGPGLIRRHVLLTRLSTNNEVAGFKFATIGVLYAVMVAFAIIVVWEKFSEAEMMIAQEAGAVATIFRLSKGAGAELAPALQSEMTKYTDTVIEQDWPTMAKAERGSARASSQALNELYATTLAFNPDSSRETSIQREILSQMDVITASRRVRTVLSAGIMPVLSGGFCSGGSSLQSHSRSSSELKTCAPRR